jgi:scyllo-inositol 2-dehydrogenase (NADP+)
MGRGVHRVALIGYGLAGSVFHGPLLEALPEYRVAFVVTGNEQRAAVAEANHPGVQVVKTAEVVWERASEVDLVVVATPNREHLRMALAAIEVGLPVAVDKPLAPTIDQGLELVHAAEKSGVLLTVFQNRRWDGDFLTVRRLVGEGALGEVHRFESRFERWRPQVGEAWREDPDPDAGGGLLLDLGSHLIDQALVLFGPARAVHAEIRAVRSGAAVDDDSFVAIEHSSGVVSHLWMSAVAADIGPRFRVLGSAGSYVKHGLDPQEAALREGVDPPDDVPGTLFDGEHSRMVATLPGRYADFYKSLAISLTEESLPPVDPNDSIDVLKIVEMSRKVRK